jgi:hypothetical protein
LHVVVALAAELREVPEIGDLAIGVAGVLLPDLLSVQAFQLSGRDFAQVIVVGGLGIAGLAGDDGGGLSRACQRRGIGGCPAWRLRLEPGAGASKCPWS